MERILSRHTTKNIGDEVMVMGWVNSRRDHGGLIFIDLRDELGIVQLTVTPESNDTFKIAETVRDEYVVKAIGTINERSDDLKNPNIETGTVEIKVHTLEILNKSEPIPFQLDDDNTGEDIRLKYRYIDLRRPKMQHILKERTRFNKIVRQYMDDKDFTEVATPILANSSPEGARDFLIPSRVHPGKFYALPQAPQQFKQLLMVGGVPRYYQLATCFRDEDPRADRLYGDFYQLDLEVAFATDGEEIRRMTEPLIVKLVEGFGKKVLFEEIPRMTYDEAMNKYGSDKPDLRYGMELVNLSDELKDVEFSVFAGTIKDGGQVKAICVDNGTSLSRSQIDKLTDIAKSEGAGGLAYISLEDGEVKSPIAKFFKKEELDTIIEKMDAKDGDTIFFGADTNETVNKVLGMLRTEFATHFELRDDSVVALAWIVDFPYYEKDEKTGKPEFGHNPFSMPKGGLEELGKEDLLSITADQYDMVANGYEICSGAIRNHNPEIMYKAFGNLGFETEYVDKKFGGMINAFKYGAPPHGGCAFGVDRLFMILMDEPNIREVIAFPKNGSGVDLMMDSPTTIDDKQLDELSIKTIEPED